RGTTGNARSTKIGSLQQFVSIGNASAPITLGQVDPQLGEQCQRATHVILESSTRLLYPAERFRISTCFVQCVDQVQIRSFRIWSVWKACDELFVCVNCVVSTLQTKVSSSELT